MVVVLTVVAAFLAVWGVIALINGDILWGIILLVVAAGVGPGGWTFFNGRSKT